MKKILPLLLILTCGNLLGQKIHIAFLWHMHQPIYFPGETIVETESAAHYAYSVYGIHTDRTGPYTSWPSSAVNAAAAAGLEHAGAQVSFSGSLIENLDNLELAGVGSFENWRGQWSQSAAQLTSLGNPRMDLVGFGYNHPLMAFLSTGDISQQIARHRSLLSDAIGSPASKGIFPPENAFATHMIPGLISQGLEWVLVDNSHFERACVDYPYSTGTNLVEPNPADLLNPNPGDWQNLNGLWCPSEISARWAHQPHYTQYVDPETEETSRIIAVPASRYIGNEDGRGGFGALQYDLVLSQLESANTDPDHPVLVVIAHDGDNHGGGTNSYYNHNFDQFVAWVSAQSDRFEFTTIQDYLDQYPPAENDVIHVEPGSWSGADNGDPEFKKWNADPNGEGYSADRNSWAVMMALSNRLETAQQSQPNHPDLIQASRYLHIGQSSDYWYWDWAQGGIWDTHPTRAANLAAALVDPLLTGSSDLTGPTIFLPQREPYNPGGTEWHTPQSSNFKIWTLVYDHSTLDSVTLKVRVDEDGFNDLTDSNNDTYAGGTGVGAWQSFSMTAVDINSQTNEAPQHIAQQFETELTDFREVLLDYYVEAVDLEGNMSSSPIQHVYVGEGSGGSGGGYSMDGQLDDMASEIITSGDLTLWVDYDGQDLYVAAPAAASLGEDVFILVSDGPGSLISAPWAKAGQTASWDVFLGNESTNNWSGWFDQDALVSQASGDVLEGTIQVSGQWPDLPDTLFLAVTTYETPDGGALTQQLPQGNGDGNLDADEYISLFLDHSLTNVKALVTPQRFQVGPAYPNPFNSETHIRLDVLEDAHLEVNVYDLRGRLVESLTSGELSAGSHVVSWNAGSQASGVYFLVLDTGSESVLRRVVLNR